MSNDYFGALLRSAGRLAPGLPSPPTAATGPFDPFEAVVENDGAEWAAQAIEPIEAAAADPSPDLPPTSPPMAAAQAPLSRQEPLPQPLAHDAHPNIRAALRWVAAGPEADSRTAEPHAVRHEPAAVDRTNPPLAAGAVASRRQTGQASPAAMARIEHMTPLATTVSDHSSALLARAPSPEAPVIRAKHAAPPGDLPARARAAIEDPVRRTERSSNGDRTVVRIGTLNVTLDASTTARFAARTVAPPTPELPSRAAAGAGHGSANGSRANQGSALSRSRLPRW